ncbi:MAG: OmpA family protein [Flavobacteriales bacterium]|nr:OmpA family protein [Flavobacteriales bacterium]MCB9167630.1 OmpA family protein [Flavobacteriales bacterium]
MNIRHYVLFVSTLAAGRTLAQEVPDSVNMVPNGGFEEVDGKLKRLGSIDMAKPWGSPTEVKADLYSGNVSGAASAPQNEAGEQGALSGDNYAGLLWWSYMNKEPRSYLQVKFKKMLTKGQKYCVRYYVSLADRSKYASDQLGAYMSRMLIKKDEESNLTYDAQVPALKTQLYEDPFTWQGVCGPYEAKGDEQYMVIGNFASNEKTNTSKIKRPRGMTGPQLFQAYYYIDDIAVFPIKLLSECSCTQLDKAESEFIYGRKGAVNKTLPPTEQIARSVIYFKRFQRGVDGAMDDVVERLDTLLKADPNIRINLIGHTDAIEADRVRMRPDLTELGKERADAVKAVLIEGGVAAERITTEGRKADEPADAGDDEVALSKNRRVEVDITQ